MRNYDIGRMSVFPQDDKLLLGSRSEKTIYGVTSKPMIVWIETGGNRLPYQAFPAGRFRFNIRSDAEVYIQFEVEKGGVVALVDPAMPTVVEGDPEQTWTTVGHRPAINPELAAVMRHMKVQEHEIRTMRSQLDATQTQLSRSNAEIRKAARTAAISPDGKTPEPKGDGKGVTDGDKQKDGKVPEPKPEPKVGDDAGK